MTSDLFSALEQIDTDNPISDIREKRLEKSSTEKKREHREYPIVGNGQTGTTLIAGNEPDLYSDADYSAIVIHA